MQLTPSLTSLTGSLDALVREFHGIFPAHTVERVLLDSRDRLTPASVEAFLPLLAQRFARERLRALSRPRPGQEPTTDDPALVLFVCGANSGRSQLAAALLARRSGGRVAASSAGTAPAARVQPEVLTVLAELGIDGRELYPKPVTPEIATAADVVVTLGCTELVDLDESPRHYLDWDLQDPAGLDLDDVRRIRDELAVRVDHLVTTLTTPTEARPG